MAHQMLLAGETFVPIFSASTQFFHYQFIAINTHTVLTEMMMTDPVTDIQVYL